MKQTKTCTKSTRKIILSVLCRDSNYNLNVLGPAKQKFSLKKRHSQILNT